MRARNIWVSRSEVSVPLANAAFTSAMVAASRSMARCADTVVQAASTTTAAAMARSRILMAGNFTA
jgi:hypothetical protein